MEAAAVPLWSSRRVREALAYAGLAGIAGTSAAIVAGAESGLSILVPAAKVRYPGWLQGPLGGIDLGLEAQSLAWLLAGMSLCYLLVLACADALAPRIGLATIVALHVLFLIAPPLLSSDVFGYIDTARLGTLHGIDPYSSASTHLPRDAVHVYRRWATDLPSPYGPLFTLASYALVPLGIAGGLWGFKVLAAAGSLATVWLVWRCAASLGRDPLRAALFVGLNPLVLVFAVGGAHNDFFAVTAAAAAVYIAIVGRERLSGAAFVAASAFKLPLGLPLAFALARPRAKRRELLIGAATAIVAVGAISVIAFGSHALGFLTQIREQQHQVALYSIPNQLGKLLGLGGVTGGIRIAMGVTLAAAIAAGLRATWRGADWIAAAGWATLALLVTSAWLLPWYLTWVLAPAAISGDRRLRAAALALTAYVVVTRVTLWTSLPG
jgi:alpha-1,6-mannosyltransferase